MVEAVAALTPRLLRAALVLAHSLGLGLGFGFCLRLSALALAFAILLTTLQPDNGIYIIFTYLFSLNNCANHTCTNV